MSSIFYKEYTDEIEYKIIEEFDDGHKREVPKDSSHVAEYTTSGNIMENRAHPDHDKYLLVTDGQIVKDTDKEHELIEDEFVRSLEYFTQADRIE